MLNAPLMKLPTFLLLSLEYCECKAWQEEHSRIKTLKDKHFKYEKLKKQINFHLFLTYKQHLKLR